MPSWADAKLIAPERQGRHRYFRIATSEVAQAIENLSLLVGDGPPRHHPTGPRDAALRRARTCYDHIAGRLGVALADAMQANGWVSLVDGANLVTPAGFGFLADLGVELDDTPGSKRPLCRTCLDWSERRYHLSGRLGTALLVRLQGLVWIERSADSRALVLTASGHRHLAARFRLPPDWLEER